MKKNRFILILTVIIVATATFFIFQNKSGTIRKEDRDFAVKDTASVTKIFLADRSGHAVTLERQPDGNWKVNNKFKARQDGINLLLDCFKRISVQTRVGKAAYNSVIKELSSTGIKCEIYVNHDDKPLKVYYVGGSTQDILGTFMMLENSTVPFVTEIPGFQGYLTPRYSSMERDWQETIIINYSPEEIKSVSIIYNFEPVKSFIIEKSNNSYTVSSPAVNKQLDHPDTMHIKTYLTCFRNIHFEGWDRNFTEAQTDSLRHVQPPTVLTVAATNGRKTTILIYPKPITATSITQSDSLGRPLKYDLDRMYAFINDGRDLVTIQYYPFNKIFASIDNFDLRQRNTQKPRE